MSKKTIRYAGKTWKCTKVKNRNVLICSPKMKGIHHVRKHRKSHRKHK